MKTFAYFAALWMLTASNSAFAAADGFTVGSTSARLLSESQLQLQLALPVGARISIESATGVVGTLGATLVVAAATRKLEWAAVAGAIAGPLTVIGIGSLAFPGGNTTIAMVGGLIGGLAGFGLATAAVLLDFVSKSNSKALFLTLLAVAAVLPSLGASIGYEAGRIDPMTDGMHGTGLRAAPAAIRLGVAF